MAGANNLEQLISQFEPRLQRAFLDSVYALRDQAHIEQIVRMLETGDVDGAIRAVGLDAASFRPLDKAIADSFEAGGNATANLVPVARDALGFRSVFQFSVRNIAAESWLRDHSSGLVTDILDDQRTAIRNFLQSGLSEGANPRTTALDLVGRISKATGKREGGVIGLTSSQEEWVRNYAAELASDNPASALVRNLRDKRFDRTVTRAAEDGRKLTSAEIDPMVRAYKNRALRYRAEVISRTETLKSLHQAQEMALDQAIAKGSIKAQDISLIWHSARDDRVRDAHRHLNGKKIKRGGVFQSELGPIKFPGDPDATPENTVQCRCWLETSFDFLSGIK